jgi:hypothetical protein
MRGTTDKSEFHEQVYGAGKIDGIEVANSLSFYPPIVRRCVEEKLFMLGGSDIHNESLRKFGSLGVYRTMTFIMAKELTEAAIKDALLKHRTIAYSGGYLIGEEKWLVELLNESVDCRMVLENKEKGTRKYQFTNHSSIPYTLRKGKKTYVLEPFKSIFIVFGKDEEGKRYLEPTFRIENMWHVDYQHPTIEIELDK